MEYTYRWRLVPEVAPNFGSFFDALMSPHSCAGEKVGKEKEKEEKKAFQATVVTSSASRPVTPTSTLNRKILIILDLHQVLKMHARLRNSTEVEGRLAGQIFCQMLLS